MIEAGPAERQYDPAIRPVLSLLRTLAARRDLWHVALERQGFKLELRRSAPAKGAS